MAYHFHEVAMSRQHPAPNNAIVVRGARQHNLKNIDVTLPRDRLTVITGPSGSGKSSLAFDTIYAEGRRRYVESLSAYARQFLGLMQRPDADTIEGLSPAISISQHASPPNPRSTVGTATEIYDFMRLLFARIGVLHCPRCGKPVCRQAVPEIVAELQSLPAGLRYLILAPVKLSGRSSLEAVYQELLRAGFPRVRINGMVMSLEESPPLSDGPRTFEVVVDRLVSRGDGVDMPRLMDSVQTALRLGDGFMLVQILGEGESREIAFSEKFACMGCGISFPEVEPRLFSFNSPYGACPACTGLGMQTDFDPDLVIPDKSLSLRRGAIRPWSRGHKLLPYYAALLESAGQAFGIDLDAPISQLSLRELNILLYGAPRSRLIEFSYVSKDGERRRLAIPFEGVIPYLRRHYRESPEGPERAWLERFMSSTVCPVCEGRRLRPEALAVRVAGLNIAQAAAMSVRELSRWCQSIIDSAAQGALSNRDRAVASQVLAEIQKRLGFLENVGLSYLTLDRPMDTLAGGEAQRVRLATQLGSRLTGVLYVLDEPTIGLHPRDTEQLIQALLALRDLGNTILVVEHDPAIIRAADYIVELGPGAGQDGGYVVAAGPAENVLCDPRSVTGHYLRGELTIRRPGRPHVGDGTALLIRGAREHNLKNIDVRIPLHQFVCVTGVSGSGKSSLVVDILYKALAQRLYRSKDKPGACRAVEGMELVDKVVNVDQSPIGRTPRSNPATYTGLFSLIRELYASLPEARARGFRPGRFSFNIKGGRCETCQGEGMLRIEMQFLPDVYVPCEACGGTRYNPDVLEIAYRGKNIAQVLDMTVREALDFFSHLPKIRNRLKVLEDVGLGYIRLGQPATTLSGGEAQRVKLAKELSRRQTGRTVYILDEPTTGLFFTDIERLLAVLWRLVDQGNTVIVVEHNLDVIKCADWVIDLGPEGGEEGGYLVAEGTPEQIALTPGSITGQYLRTALQRTEQGVP